MELRSYGVLGTPEIQRQQNFDRFCKKVLKHEVANGHRELGRRALIEIPMSELLESAMEQLGVYDEYPGSTPRSRLQ